MELKQYWDIIWRRKWLILATLLISLMVAAAGTFATAPIYRASTTLRIATATEGSVGNVRYDLNYADRLMKTYENIATSAPVLFKLNQVFGEVDKTALSVEIVANTELMLIQAEDTDPARAADISNMAADLLLLEMENSDEQNQSASEQIEREINKVSGEVAEARVAYETIRKTEDANSEAALDAERVLRVKRDFYASLLSTSAQARLADSAQGDTASITIPAGIPEKPAKPNVPLNLALGAFLGLLGGLGLAFVFENFDKKLHTREQVQAALELPTLGRIPSVDPNSAGKYGAPLEEAYRRLGANVLSYTRQADHKVFVVTSALTGEGKSTVSANLASSLAYSGLTVAIVDCDLHHPSLHVLFNISNERGLTSVLSKQTSLSESLQKPPMLHVSVLASGPISANPYDTQQSTTNGVMRRVHPGQVELLSTAQMVATIDTLRDRFDIILLDTAPLLEVTDAAVLSPLADGVILVADLFQAQQDILREVRQQLDDVNANVIGCVLTRDNSSLAYYKSLRRQDKRAPLGNQPNYANTPNQAYGSYIAMPTELTRVARTAPNGSVTQSVKGPPPLS